MAYLFEGFFCRGGKAVLEAAAAQWPFCSTRLIDSPFKGIGVATAAGWSVPSDEIAQVRKGLIPWSRCFPDLTFIYLSGECFGGPCLYAGYACRDGIVLLEEFFNDQDDWDASAASLRRLLEFLEVEIEYYFEAFTRDYFTRPDAAARRGSDIKNDTSIP
jgi:hypothetical protein